MTRTGPRVGTRDEDEKVNLTIKAASWVEVSNTAFVSAGNVSGGEQLDRCTRLGHVRELRLQRDKGWAMFKAPSQGAGGANKVAGSPEHLLVY
jgi:hypothetical protein